MYRRVEGSLTQCFKASVPSKPGVEIPRAALEQGLFAFISTHYEAISKLLLVVGCQIIIGIFILNYI